MMIFRSTISYFLWDVNSELFSIGSFTLRWNAVFLIAAYITGRQLLFYIYKKEGKAEKDAATLTTYLTLAILLGARIGHVILYEPELITIQPLQIIFPFEFDPAFRFTASRGFSAHGATFGILLGLWLYSRKNKPGQDYVQLLDRSTLLAAVAGFMMLTGSILNSDLTGKRTDAGTGTVFIKQVTSGLLKVPCCVMRIPGGENPLQAVAAKKDEAQLHHGEDQQSLILYLFFKPGASEKLVNEFLIGDVKNFLYDMDRIVYEPGTKPLDYRIMREKDGNYIARIKTSGLPIYPVQMFEAISALLLFIFLFRYWNQHKTNIPPARLFGYFMVIFWGFHFVYGFLKENYTAAETSLDIFFVLVGLASLVYSYQYSRQTLKIERKTKHKKRTFS